MNRSIFFKLLLIFFMFTMFIYILLENSYKQYSIINAYTDNLMVKVNGDISFLALYEAKIITSENDVNNVQLFKQDKGVWTEFSSHNINNQAKTFVEIVADKAYEICWYESELNSILFDLDTRHTFQLVGDGNNIDTNSQFLILPGRNLERIKADGLLNSSIQHKILFPANCDAEDLELFNQMIVWLDYDHNLQQKELQNIVLENQNSPEYNDPYNPKT